MSILFDARDVATPTQRLRSAERSARLNRISGRAYGQLAALPPQVLPAPPAVPNVNPDPFVFAVNYHSFPPNEPLALQSDTRPSIRQIQRETLKRFPHVTMIDLASSRRTAAVVRPRQIAMYVAKSITLWSLPAIGRSFGGKDHTTVLHAVRKITSLIFIDPDIAQTVGEIINDLGCQDV